MSDKHTSTIQQIDNYIRKNSWFDFKVLRYEGRTLIIVGGTDLLYNHSIEITFTNVFFASMYFEGWRSETNNPVIEIPNLELNKELNFKFGIEQGHQVFIMHAEDFENDIYIAAEEVEFDTDPVYYFQNDNLDIGEL